MGLIKVVTSYESAEWRSKLLNRRKAYLPVAVTYTILPSFHIFYTPLAFRMLTKRNLQHQHCNLTSQLKPDLNFI